MTLAVGVFALVAALTTGTANADNTTLRPLAPAAGTYHAVQPARILDTRSGIGAPAAAITGGGTVNLTVLGHGGVPASGVSAVVLNVTAVDPTSEGFVTVYPTGGTRPDVSNLNFVANQNVANATTVVLGDNGQLSFYNAFGSTHVLADVVGWYDETGTGGGRYNALTPDRILDTRNGIGATKAPLGADGKLDLVVTGKAGVPASGVSAVVVNLTATNQTSEGYLTLWPTGSTTPDVSNLNFTAGNTVANLATVGVNQTTGAISVFNKFGNTDVILDVLGWYDTAGTQGSVFHPVNPHRVLDTRPTHNGLNGDQIGAYGFTDGDLPLEATAVVVNVTATETTSAGYLTLFPAHADSLPTASTVNWNGPRSIVPNMAVIDVSSENTIGFYNAFGYVDVLLDMAGYFAAS
jgi:hypothetical protein